MVLNGSYVTYITKSLVGILNNRFYFVTNTSLCTNTPIRLTFNEAQV